MPGILFVREKREQTCFGSEIYEPKRPATCHPQAQYAVVKWDGESQRNTSTPKGQEEEHMAVTAL